MIAHAPLPSVLPQLVPHHVAIIMDGNRRWAESRGLSSSEGHARGMDALDRTVVAARNAGVRCLTVYAFSEENWARDAAEVSDLLALAARFAAREIQAPTGSGVRIRAIGRRDRLPESLCRAFEALETHTADETRLTLNVAVDYGARSEVAAAARALAREVAAGTLAPDAINELEIARRLWTAGQPDPDLLIRTGGELRLSNFLLYQCAYAELWSTPIPWPEFDAATFGQALDAYASRQRRFGK